MLSCFLTCYKFNSFFYVGVILVVGEIGLAVKHHFRGSVNTVLSSSSYSILVMIRDILLHACNRIMCRIHTSVLAAVDCGALPD